MGRTSTLSALSVLGLGCALYAGLLAASRSSEAYCLQTVGGTSGFYAWQQLPQYSVSENMDATMRAAVDAAFATWSNVSCSTFQASSAGTFPLATTLFDDHGPGIFIFYYTTADDFPTIADVPATSLLLVDEAGGIVQASIAINAFSYAWDTNGAASAFDLQAELTSLIGLAIGLTTSNASQSVMTGTLAYSDLSKRMLSPDDEAALQYLYGDPGCSAPPAPGAGGCSTAGTSNDPPPSSPPPPPSSPPTASGCSSSTKCASGQVCTAEGTCVISDGSGSGGSCASYVECDAGEVCTIEGSCVGVGVGQTSSNNSAAEPSDGPPPQTTMIQESAGGCTSSDACAAGEVCTAEGVCLAAAAHGADDGADSGGGCAIGAAAPQHELTVWLLLLLLLLARDCGDRRRRRRRQRLRLRTIRRH